MFSPWPMDPAARKAPLFRSTKCFWTMFFPRFAAWGRRGGPLCVRDVAACAAQCLSKTPGVGLQGKILFPDRTGKSHIKKDIVCHAIQKARCSFKAMDSHKITSHSRRHTMINTLKSENVPADAGMSFARIFHTCIYIWSSWPAKSVASKQRFEL